MAIQRKRLHYLLLYGYFCVFFFHSRGQGNSPNQTMRQSIHQPCRKLSAPVMCFILPMFNVFRASLDEMKILNLNILQMAPFSMLLADRPAFLCPIRAGA